MDTTYHAKLGEEEEPKGSGQMLRRSAVFFFVSIGAVSMLSLSGERPTPSTELSASASASAKRVKVELYGMAGCPFTRGFVLGPMTEALEDLSAQIDFIFEPFGNSYYATKECGGSTDLAGMKFAAYNRNYSAADRECWETHCGSAATHAAEDCFQGSLVTQHGVSDGLVTAVWGCAKHLAGGVAERYWPFVTCTGRKFLSITDEDKFNSVVRQCAVATGFDANQLLRCSRGAQGQALLHKAGRATPVHPGVPFLRVADQVVNDTSCVTCGDGVVSMICKALKDEGGSESDVCKWVLG